MKFLLSSVGVLLMDASTDELQALIDSHRTVNGAVEIQFRFFREGGTEDVSKSNSRDVERAVEEIEDESPDVAFYKLVQELGHKSLGEAKNKTENTTFITDDIRAHQSSEFFEILSLENSTVVFDKSNRFARVIIPQLAGVDRFKLNDFRWLPKQGFVEQGRVSVESDGMLLINHPQTNDYLRFERSTGLLRRLVSHGSASKKRREIFQVGTVSTSSGSFPRFVIRADYTDDSEKVYAIQVVQIIEVRTVENVADELFWVPAEPGVAIQDERSGDPEGYSYVELTTPVSDILGFLDGHQEFAKKGVRRQFLISLILLLVGLAAIAVFFVKLRRNR